MRATSGSPDSKKPGYTPVVKTGSMHDAARSLLSCNLSVIPAKDKRPALAEWKPYQQERMLSENVPVYFNGSPQVAIICGAVSGNLEVVDVDLKHDDSGSLMYDLSHLISNADEDLWNKLVMQKTVSGGVHIIYRCEKIAGNQKLAKRADNNEVLIETRGEGGYIIAAPSAGYMLFSGHKFEQIPTITIEQRELILAAARSFNQVKADPAPFKAKEHASEWQLSPGDDFDQRGDVLELLQSHGWSIVLRKGEKVWLKRPGNTDAAHSANWNVIPGRFWCWSTSTVFESETVYKPYAVYAMLEHGGDYSAAAKALLAKGYGKAAESETEFTPPDPGATTPEALPLKKITRYALESEYGLAKIFCHLKGHEYIHDKEYKEWRHYQGGIWKMDSEKRLFSKVPDIIKREIKKPLAKVDTDLLSAKGKEETQRLENLRKELLQAGKSLNKRATVQNLLAFSESMLSTLSTNLDKNPYQFNLKNGTYDFETNSFKPHDPRDLLSKKAGFYYNPSARCSQWIDFLNTIFESNTELIAFIQRVVGYSLTGLSDMQALLFCYGGGGNGKTIFFSVLEMLIGDYYTNIPIDLLLSKERSNTDEYQLAKLRGVRCVVASEIPEGKRMNESQVKDMTGGDTINARVPHGMPFTFAPTHTLWMFGNHKPIIKGTDAGIWRRINLIPFLYTVPKEKRKDKNIMMAEFKEELSGIFNWAIEGFQDYQKNGLNPPEIVRAATDEYKQDSNNFMQFMDECCVKTTGTVQCKKLFKSYCSWCEDQGEKPKFYNPKQMNEFVRTLGFEIKTSTGNVAAVFGLMLNVSDSNNYENAVSQ